MNNITKMWAQRFKDSLDNIHYPLQHDYLSLTWHEPDAHLDYQRHKVHLIMSAHETLWEFFFNSLLVARLRESEKIYIIDGQRDADYLKRNITMALCDTSPYDIKPSAAKELKLHQTYEEIKEYLFIEDQEMIATDLRSYFKLCDLLTDIRPNLMIINLPTENYLTQEPLITMLDKIAQEHQLTIFINKPIPNVTYYHFPHETDIKIPINEKLKLQSLTSLYKPEVKPKHRWESDLDKKGEDYAQVNVIRNKNGALKYLEMSMAYRCGVLKVYED
jgi:hypothetical protein